MSMFDFGKYRSTPAPKAEVIVNKFEDIDSIGDVRMILEEQGLIEPGFELTQSDYEAIVRRAGVLKDENPSIAQDEAIAAGFIDRLTVLGETGLALLKMMPVEVLQNIFRQRTGNDITPEEVAMFISYIEAGHKPEGGQDVTNVWTAAREEVLGTVPDNTAVIDGQDNVVGVGNESEAALLKQAVEERQ